MAGSCPRMRGTRSPRRHARSEGRIIPAHAGNSVVYRIGSPVEPDHPRACGELALFPNKTKALHGSSPRMRGTLGSETFKVAHGRIIPAHAGNSSSPTAYNATPSDHPRACGELGRRCTQHHDPIGSSPRMRGTLGSETFKVAHGRIIPAHAGNSSSPTAYNATPSDHPRACGELT